MFVEWRPDTPRFGSPPKVLVADEARGLPMQGEIPGRLIGDVSSGIDPWLVDQETKSFDPTAPSPIR